MTKILIAYFSHEGEYYADGTIKNHDKGNTATMAEKIQALLPDADMFRIETVEPYPAGYTECVKRAVAEHDANARPTLKKKVEQMEQYDTIVLGYPCWHGTMPMAVFTFLSSHNMRGKTIIPFCTNEGSGMGHSEEDIKKLCHSAKIKPGTAIRGIAVAQANTEAESIAYMAR